MPTYEEPSYNGIDPTTGLPIDPVIGGGANIPTTNSTPVQTPTTSLTAFFNSNPAYLAEYNRVTAMGDSRSPEQWMQGHINVSPQDQTKYNTFIEQNQPGGSNTTTPTVTPPAAPAAGTGLTGLVDTVSTNLPSTTPAATTTTNANGSTTTSPVNTGVFVQAPTPSDIGGNYNQVQNSVQGGQFSTAGTTTQNQTQDTSQTQSGTQTGTQSQDTSSTSTSTPTDTLGLGSMLTDQAGTTAQSDAARNAWLSDLMSTGGTQFNSQVDQAVRNSLSGSQMTGAGDSARARAAGYAASDTARNNLTQRLGAAEQLGGGTGLTSLVSAATPFMGQTNTTTGSSDSISNLANTLNTSSLSNLTSSGTEAQAGITNAQSSQAGAGTIPEGQAVQSGGCVVCTAAIGLGLSNHRRVLREVINHKVNTERKRFHFAVRGYLSAFTPFAAWLLRHPKIAAFVWPIAKGVVYEELRIAGRHLPLRKRAWLVHWTWHYFCSLIGHLPVKGYVTNEEIKTIARREKILFNLEEQS